MDEEQQGDWLGALAVSCKRLMERIVWYSYYELITIGAISQLGSLALHIQCEYLGDCWNAQAWRA